jgi:exosortase
MAETIQQPILAHRPPTRRDVAVAAGLASAAVATTFDAWADILRLGLADEELSYLLLAPVVIGWLAWVRRDRLRAGSVRSGWVGLIVLAFGWFVYAYGFVTDPVLWRAGAVVVLAGAVISALGADVLLRCAPALAAMVSLIPVLPNGRYRVAMPLQTATARATQAVCDVLGWNVDRSGNLLSINGVDVTVAEACNGMRMVLTLFLVCYVVAFTMRLRTWVRVLILAAAPLVAIASNVLRLVPTVWMFGHTSAAAAERFHDVSGWVMTVLSFLALMGLAKLLEGDSDESSAVPTGGGTAARPVARKVETGVAV